MLQDFTIATHKQRDFIDITLDVQQHISSQVQLLGERDQPERGARGEPS